MLPAVDFCGLKVTRLVIGANPFGGFSHQDRRRDEEMRAYYTVERILETWKRAHDAGINTMVTNNESAHVMEAVRKYRASGGPLQWIAQVNSRLKPNMEAAIDEVVDIGCKAIYFHGALVDKAYQEKNAATLEAWCKHVHRRGVPVGVAGHVPEAHRWINMLGIVDFHAVCCFNCGSVHAGKGEKFQLTDLPAALDCVRSIAKPCIAYKIMGAGRIDARMAFENAFRQIKPGDVVNVGMYRKDKDGMVEENAGIVRELLSG